MVDSMSDPVPPPRRRVVLPLALLALAATTLACEKIQPPPPPQVRQHGELPSSPIVFRDAIPLDYGRLVAVTPHATSDEWAALWFERDDHTISVVWVNVVEGRLHDEVVSIPRR